MKEIRAGLNRALVRVQAAAENYPQYRDCFSCHHQTLPVVAMVAARNAGMEIDEGLLHSSIEFTTASFRSRIESLKRGSGIGGRAMTVGYGLWTLWEPQIPGDELTEAMSSYLLQTQEADGRWVANPLRPPLEDSEVTSTVLAALGLDRYAAANQRAEANRAIDAARRWLQSAPLASQEDHNATLWGLWYLDPDERNWAESRKLILDAQRPDGGWAQEPGMTSDAYATGQTLAILHLTGLASDDRRFERGLRYLLDTQQPDGSWRVETRSHPVQAFFDNGDPHGASQFISTSATCWAAAALAGALEAP